MDFEKLLGDLLVIPVVEIPSADDAVPSPETLAEAGLPCAEITFRTASAADAIAAIAAAVPGFTVGAGTVLTVAQAETAVAAGATLPRLALLRRHCHRLRRGAGRAPAAGRLYADRDHGRALPGPAPGQAVPGRGRGRCVVPQGRRRPVRRRALRPHGWHQRRQPGLVSARSPGRRLRRQLDGKKRHASPTATSRRSASCRGGRCRDRRSDGAAVSRRCRSSTINARGALPLGPRRPRRGHAPARPRRGAHRDDALVPGLGGRRRVQRRPRSAALLRPAHRRRHGARRQPGRPARRGPDAAGRRRPVVTCAGCPTTASGARSATGSTSPSAASASAAPSAAPTAGTQPPSPAAAGRRRLGRDLRRARAPAGSTAAASSPRSARPTAAVAAEAMAAARRHGDRRLLRPQLPAVAVEVDRRPGARPRGQPRARAARRRDARQRGGLQRRPRLRGRGRRRGPRPTSTRERFGRMMSQVVRRVSRTSRVVATTLRAVAQRDAQRLERRLLGGRAPARSTAIGPASRSSTASAAATRSPPVSSTGCSRASTSQLALEYGAAHGALAMTTPGDMSMATRAEVEALRPRCPARPGASDERRHGRVRVSADGRVSLRDVARLAGVSSGHGVACPQRVVVPGERADARAGRGGRARRSAT